MRRLNQLESLVHYKTDPPPGHPPFTVLEQPAPVLVSAPHGAVTFRGRRSGWHEEDRFTAGMALLLGELCGVSVIATLWRTRDSDPNYHLEERSPYKRKIRELVERYRVQWVIDLHGMRTDSGRSGPRHLVDLGTRNRAQSLEPGLVAVLTNLINEHLGGGQRVHQNGFPACETRSAMSVTAFCHRKLGIQAVQVEMKPQVRIPPRDVDGPSSRWNPGVAEMVQALSRFIDHLTCLRRGQTSPGHGSGWKPEGVVK